MNSYESLQLQKNLRKRKLFKDYINKPQIYKVLLNDFNSSNVHTFSWKNNDQKTRMISSLRQIQSMSANIKDQQELQLEQMIASNPNINETTNFFQVQQLLLNKEDKVNINDLKSLISDFDLRKDFYTYVINTDDYRKWCLKYQNLRANPQQQTVVIPQKIQNPVVPQTSSQSNVYTPQDNSQQNTIQQLRRFMAENRIDSRNSQYPRCQTLAIQKLTQKQQFIKKRIQYIQKKYSKDIIQLELWKITLYLSQSTTSFIQLEDIKTMLEKQNRFNINGLEKYYNQRKLINNQRIYKHQIAQQFIEYLEPLDIWEIQERCVSAEFPKQISKALNVLGETGVGKSTFILSLFYQLQPVTFDNLTALKTKQPLKKQHQTLIAKPSLDSVTDKVHVYNIKIGSKQIGIMDTPGFQDTRGPTVDIANQLMTTNATKMCKQIAYVLLIEISSLNIDRGIRILELAENIALKFSYENIEDLKKMILLLFNNKNNKMNDMQINNLKQDSSTWLKNRQGFNQYKIKDSTKIAYQFIVDSLKDPTNLYSPLDRKYIEELKKKIGKLTYSSTVGFKSNIQTSMIDNIRKSVIILQSNIEFYMQKKMYDRIPYYYDQLNILYKRVQQHVSDKKQGIDARLIKKSQEIFDLFAKILKQQISTLQFSEKDQAQLMQSYNELILMKKISQSNPNIKSQSHIKTLITDVAESLIGLVEFKIGKQKIQNGVKLILIIFASFKQYIPDLLNKIEKKCFKFIQKAVKQIKQSFMVQNLQKFDQLIFHYDFFEIFYRTFESENISKEHFINIQKIKPINDIVNDYKKSLQTFISEIYGFLNQIKQACLKNQSKLNKDQILKLNQIYKTLSIWKFSKALCLTQQIQKYERKEKQDLQTLKDSMMKQMLSFLQFGEGFELKAEGIKIKRQNFYILCSFVKAEEVNKLLNNGKTELQSQILIIINNFKSGLNNLLGKVKSTLSIKQQKQNMKHLTKKTHAIDLFIDDNKDKLMCICQNFLKQFKSFEKTLNDFLKKNSFENLKLEQIKQFFASVQIFINYRQIDDITATCVQQFQVSLHKKQEEYCKIIAEKIKIKQITNLFEAQKINKSLLDIIRSYVDNFLEPCRQFKLFQPYKDIHLQIYKNILIIFVSFDTLLKDCKVFSSKLICDISNSVKIQEGNEKHKSQPLRKQDVVKLLIHIYTRLNDITPETTFFKYLNNSLRLNFSEQSINVSEILKEIETILNKKGQSLDIQLKRINATTKLSHISLLLRETQYWAPLYDVIIQLSNDNQLRIDFKVLQSQLSNKVQELSQKLLSKLQRILDTEFGKINYLQCQRQFYELKINIKNNILQAQNNMQTFIQRFNRCLQFKQQALNRVIHEANSFLDQQILNIFYQMINIFKKLKIWIKKEDIDQFHIYSYQSLFTKLSDLRNDIYQQSLQMEGNIKNQIEQRSFSEARIHIGKLKKIKNQIKDCDILLGAEVSGQNQSTRKIQQLEVACSEKQKHDFKIIENPLDQQNVDSLRTVYEKAPVSVKFQMRTRIMSKIDNKINQYEDCPSKSEANNLRKLISALIYQIPAQLNVQLKQNFEQKVREKTRYYQQQIQELLKGNYFENDLFSKLIINFIQYRQMDNRVMKKKCLDGIKQTLNKFVTSIQQITGVKDKVLQMQNIFWSHLKEQYKKYNEIDTLFRQSQQKMLSQIFRRIESIIKEITEIIDEERQVKLYLKQNKQIDELNDFCNIFYKEQQKFYSKQKYENRLDNIQYNIIRLKDNFIINCPIRKCLQIMSQQDFDARLFKQIITKCKKNINIYSYLLTLNLGARKQTVQIFLPAEKGNQKNKTQQAMEIQYHNKQSQYLNQIRKFQKQLNAFIQDQVTKLQLVNFQNTEFINASKRDVQEFIKKIADTQIKLKILLSKQLSSTNQMQSNVDIDYIVETIQYKFKFFFEQCQNKLQKAMSDIQSDFPKQFSFLQNILEIIKQGKGNFLKYSLKKQMVDQNISTDPYTRIYNFIKKITDDLKKKLLEKRAFLQNLKMDKRLLINRIQQLAEQQILEISHLSNKQTQMKNQSKTKHMEGSQSLQQVQFEIKSMIESEKAVAKEKFKKLKMQEEKRYFTKQSENLKQYCILLMITKRATLQLNSVYHQSKQNCQNIIIDELRYIQQIKMIQIVSSGLQKYQCSGYGALIKEGSDLFKYESYRKFNQKTQAQGIQYLLQNLKRQKKFGKINYNKLLDEFNQYEQKFKQCKLIYKKNPTQNTISKLAGEMFKKATSNQHQFAIITAVWSIRNSIKTEEQEIQIKPHPAQIITLLLLGDVAYNKKQNKYDIENQLAQIKTGEGKSIILATLACFFAKKGFKVSVACYSSYLSSRDYKAFQKLFNDFGVKQYIFYGTFNEICQQILNSQKDTFKEIIRGILAKETENKGLLDKAIGVLKKFTSGQLIQEIYKKFNELFNKNNDSILLVDQVDVFFEKQYFGELYRPMIKIDNIEAKALIKLIWSEVKKNRNITPAEIINTTEFKDLVNTYPKLQNIFQNQVHGMIAAALKPDHPHEIHQNTIKYKDKDKLSDKMHYGFITVFIHFIELERGRISQINFQNALFIPIMIGEFSYSQLPSYYLAIKGLSGTINSLSRNIKKFNLLQKKYKIQPKNIFMIPTIFGNTNSEGIPRIVTRTQYLQNSQSFYSKIKQQIFKQNKVGRPVLVAFKDFTDVRNFQKFFRSQKINCTLLHELQTNELRDNAIKQAGMKFRITFMTAAFSRGTDININDKVVKDLGGLHIILAYIPESRSQYQQFLGRTARQGENGSVDIIYNVNDWPKQYPAPSNATEIQEKIYQYWKNLQTKQLSEKQSKLQINLIKSNNTIECVRNIKNDLNQYISYIFQLNKHQQIITKQIKCIIGVDATISMKPLFEKLKSNLAIVIQRINQMKKDIGSNRKFSIQIVVYRNYNSGANVLQYSNEEENAEPLLKFLQKIKVQGGWGNQAIQVLYQYMNTNKPKTDVLFLIGDAPPNSSQDVIYKRNFKKYQWPAFIKNNPTLFPQTNVTIQQDKLSSELQIYGLYIKGNKEKEAGDVSQYFEKISARFHGEAKQLDFTKPDISQIMIQFFTTKITTILVGKNKASEVEDHYKEKYRSFS